MLTFSNDPKVAEQQMRAIIFYLTTFGCIDGDFDASEREYVRNYIRGLVRKRIDTGMPEADEAVRNELEEKFFAHFMEVFEGIDRHVKDLFTESVAKDEDQEAFVHAKLKLRCFEIFESFDAKNKDSLMDTVDELIAADGHVHPAELKFRNELAELLEADLNVELVEDGARPSLEVRLPTALAPPAEGHPFFQQFEFHYSAQKDMILKQVEADRALLKRASEVWKTQRAAGAGRLAGKSSVGEFAAGERFLDEFTYVVRPEPGKQYDLTVLGDLHGCYSNLKAAVLQARFFEKVEAFRNDPANAPEPMLVLLGDYIDRGMFSLNGVLRTVLQLFVTAPEHVYVLRGNHEYYVEYKGRVYGGVKPAEAINTLKPHVDEDVFRDYMRLFEEMPNVLLFNGLMMVHGGIPRDGLIKERFEDLSFLNDSDARFQMMWSDPSSAEIIPPALQEQSARFPFGRLQAASFLQRIGCHSLIRGHEKVEAGYAETYRDDHVTLITVFSAGGVTNDDLPEGSSYRTVVPHALTIRARDSDVEVAPWEIQYEKYNDPSHNAFFKAPMQIAHRQD